MRGIHDGAEGDVWDGVRIGGEDVGAGRGVLEAGVIVLDDEDGETGLQHLDRVVAFGEAREVAPRLVGPVPEQHRGVVFGDGDGVEFVEGTVRRGDEKELRGVRGVEALGEQSAVSVDVIWRLAVEVEIVEDNIEP